MNSGPPSPAFQFTQPSSIFAALSDTTCPGSTAGNQEQVEKRHRYSGSGEAIAIDYRNRQCCKYLAYSQGKLAPDIEGQDQDGRQFKLSDYRGKVVLLYFWLEY